MGKTQGGKHRGGQTSPRSPRGSPRSAKLQCTERRKWSKDEDSRLQQSIQKYGTKNWCVVAACIPDRHPKQCRERWINHLDPSITKGKISDAEWDVVLKTHVKQGNRWSEIAKLLPGRTPNQIKNYWHTMTRRALKKKRETEVCLDTQSSEEGPTDLNDEDEFYENEESNSPPIEENHNHFPVNPWAPNQQQQMVQDYESANGHNSFYYHGRLISTRSMGAQQTYDPMVHNSMVQMPMCDNSYGMNSSSFNPLVTPPCPEQGEGECGPWVHPEYATYVHNSMVPMPMDSSYGMTSSFSPLPGGPSADQVEGECGPWVHPSGSFPNSFYSAEYDSNSLLPWDLLPTL